MKTIKLDRYSFKFEDIDLVYPIYASSNKTKAYYNFKASISSGSHSRKYQLKNRSIQALLFDTLIDVGYFKLVGIEDEIIKEFPLINTRSDIDDNRSYYLLDYFIPSKSLCIELDSTYHDDRLDLDKRKDEFLKSLGIEVLRVRDFQINTKWKLDKIVKWINESCKNEFNLIYCDLIDSYIRYETELNRKAETKKSGPLGDIRPKWRKVIGQLCSHYSELNAAIETKSKYTLNIHLNDLHRIYPLKYKEVRKYNPLVTQLKLLGIDLVIKSNRNNSKSIFKQAMRS